MRLLPSRLLGAAVLGGFFEALLAAQPAPVESILPALAYGPACSSEIQLHNLSDRPVTLEVEGHRASGALVGLAGLPGTTLHLAPHQRANYKLEIPEETIGAWVKVRERSPPGLAPAVAVGASSECVAGDQLRSARRDVAFPQRNPWFDSDVATFAGGVVSLINTSPLSAMVRVCYSSGNLYSVPGRSQRPGDLAPICTVVFDLQVPPFGAREFPVERDGSSHFSLRTLGPAIVLEMLRPLDANIRIYRVDSSIRFDGDPSAASKPSMAAGRQR